MKAPFLRILVGSTAVWAAAWAQGPALSLDQARQVALQNHPGIASASLEAQAAEYAAREVRSAYFPTLAANFTGVGSEQDSVLSAGAVTTSSIANRGATGIVASQLLSDFGRTASLEQGAKLRGAAKEQNVNYTRAQVLLDVEEAYYQALAAEAVLRVAQATVNLRRTTLRQISVLAQSNLRSTVDVSFAEVNLSQAELDLVRAQNGTRASHARLSAAIGYERDQPFILNDEPLPSELNPDLDTLIVEALRDRPDLAVLRLNHEALLSYAEAEKRLRYPTISAAVVSGVAPVRGGVLPETYTGAGINVSIPVLNGGLFKARRREAESHAAAADKDTQELAVRVARDVEVAWLDANDAFQRLGVTARMVAEANEALRLAQARYDNALGSIVELNQAQVNQTAAEIAEASAKYEYLSRKADLDYAMGVLR